jgi:hypothetical protein
LRMSSTTAATMTATTAAATPTTSHMLISGAGSSWGSGGMIIAINATHGGISV